VAESARRSVPIRTRSWSISPSTRTETGSDSAAALETARYCLMDSLACAFQALDYPGLHAAARAGGARRDAAGGARVPGTGWELDPVQAAFNIGGRALAGFQRHLAGGRVGASLGQPGRNPRRGRLPRPRRRRGRGRAAAENARRARGHGQGTRDPGRDRAGKQLQPCRARPRAAGAYRLHGGGDPDARRQPRPGHQRCFKRLDRRRGAADLSPCAEHRLAQELGGGRRHQPRRAPGADRAGRARWATRRPSPPRAGASRTCCSAARPCHSRRATAVRDGERAVQGLLPGRVPCPDGGGGGDGSCIRRCATASTMSGDRHRDPGAGLAHHRQDRPAGQSGRPRSLHPVHDRHPADLRPAGGGGLRGRGGA
jgi:hypothetical protein